MRREPEGADERRSPAASLRARLAPPAVLDRLNEVVFETDAEGRWTYLNRAWTEITGFTRERTLGTHFLDYVHPDEREETVSLFAAVVSGMADHCHHETRYLTADGGSRWMELRARLLRDDAGRIVGNAGTIFDITQRRMAEELLAAQTAVLELIARDKPLEDILTALADLLRSRLGGRVRLDAEEPPEAGGNVQAGDADAAGRELVMLAPASGERVGTLTLDRDTRVDPAAEQLLERCGFLAAIAIDRRRAQEVMRHQALHDPLTGLPNRTLMSDRLQQALVAARRHGHAVALLILDLDRFKAINDTLGHDVGDEVLRHAAARLRRSLRDTDTVCRLGGDEFAIVLPEVRAAADAQHVAAAVLRELAAPLRVEDMTFGLEASVGIALSPLHGDGPEALLRRADVAMYRAKRLGGGSTVYDADFDEGRLRRVGLAAELRHAIARGQLFLDYQPKVALDGGAVVGVESLVRWQHPVRGRLAPDDFIPLAESSGLMKDLSLWVIRTARRECRGWLEDHPDLALAVNLSAGVLHDKELQAVLAEATEAGATGPLELEVTESDVMADPEGAIAALGRLGEAGVSVAIDDFGTGYSSLAYLKRLPARSIKIDKSFIHDLGTDPRDAFIVRSAIALAHDLGIAVVAEGVESQQVLDLLVDYGCDYAQGFHVAHPMRAAALARWLRPG